MNFTERKFLSLSPQKRHKECAVLLRQLYESFGKQNASNYETYCAWSNCTPRPISTLEEIANAYHFHLQAAGISLREPRFLPNVKRQDRDVADTSLGFSIYLDNLRSAHNVGSILRTVEAFRLGSVHFSASTPWVTHTQVQAASMGSYEWIECCQTDLATLPRPLIALETAPEALSLFDYTFPPQATLIVGNEEYGCSEETLAQTDLILQIPLRGKKNSLNVANAFAICAAWMTQP